MQGTPDPRATDPSGPGADRFVPSIPHRSIRPSLVIAVAVAVVATLLLAAGLDAGWFSPRSTRCQGGITLSGAGASFVLPLVTQWSVAYHQSSSDRVNYNGNGAGAGISAITGRTVDFAATDDPLIPADPALVTIPITAGALAIVYNLPGVAPPIQLSGPVLAAIYLGQITHWDDAQIARTNAGVGLPPHAIVTVHRADAAGTTYVLTDFLSQDSGAWRSGPGRGISISWPAAPTQLAIAKNSGLASYVQATPYSVGYVDLTDVLASPGLQYAKLLNPAGRYVLPTLADTSAAIANLSARTSFPPPTGDWANVTMVNSPGAGDYPLSTFAYFFVYRSLELGFAPSLAKAQAIVHWLNWSVHEGQSYSAPLFYVPLTPAVVSLDEAAIASLQYDGSSIVSCR